MSMSNAEFAARFGWMAKNPTWAKEYALVLEMHEALKTSVSITSRPSGTGGVLTIVGTDREDVLAVARSRKERIDFMRSPYVEGVHEIEGGKWQAQVRYYGLD